MTTIRFGRLIVLACMGLAVACTSGTDSGTSGNTTLNLEVVNPGGTSDELGFSIDRVDYRITCANTAVSPDIPPANTVGENYAYDDSVDISGAFEIVDTRIPPVMQAVMDLPPTDCTVTLSVWDGDEVVCIGSQTLPITEDANQIYDIVLVCSLSIDTPDGMADINGEFFFITGNLCPKIYVLNAIPSAVSADGTCNASQAPCIDDAFCDAIVPGDTCTVNTEIQYRAKDPDNSCGNNCDPQSCTFDNPPVCTPAPYNPNDPACNPAAGGDPNSAACQDGVSHVGLVCSIIAVPTASGVPGGTFISPNDLVTPTGPILPVNLNTAAGLPGIILPGLGGPVTTSSEPTGGAPGDNPLYPGLPNVNGSLPPLRYACDTSIPGNVLINLICSDGDEECDKTKQLLINCPGANQCTIAPVPDCSAPSDCTIGGTGTDTSVPGCDPTCPAVCDIASGVYDPTACAATPPPAQNVDCEQCPGIGSAQPAGTACADGGPTDQVCDGFGNCVECLSDADCGSLPAPVIPGTCQLPNTCDTVNNTCVAGGAAPAGASCANGTCDGSGPPFGTSDPPCVFQVNDCNVTGVITVGCGNNITADVSILPYLLDVRVSAADGGVQAGNPISATLDGVAEFSETFLDAAQGAVPGGVTKASLVDLVANVQVRSGSTGAPVTPVGGGATIPYECILGDTGPGAQQPCNPANDQPSVPGVRGNTDCIPTGSFNPCGRVVVIPTSADCAPAGTCDGLGKLSQCAANGFCVTGGLPLPLDAVGPVSLGTADASGAVLIGWADTPPNPLAVGVPAIDGDGTYNMLQPTYTGIAGDVGLAVNAGGLAVQLECVMAEDSGGPLGVGVPDDASPTPDVALLSCPIQVP